MSTKYVDGTTLMVTYDNVSGLYSYNRIHDMLKGYWANDAAMGTVTLPADTPLMVPILQGNSVVWDKVASMTRALPANEAAVHLELGTGASLKATLVTRLLMLQNNAFVTVPLSNVTADQMVPTSLYLPNRVGLQITGGLSISVQMALSPSDPLSQVSLNTNTWGPIVIPWGLLRNFKLSTTDASDIAAIQNIESTSVQFNVINTVDNTTMTGSIPQYWLTTVNGGTWMTANGFFLG